MKTQRTVAALFFALLISSVLTWLLSRQIVKASAHAATVAAPGTVPVEKVVTAIRDVEAGASLPGTALTETDWPAAQPMPGALHQVAAVQGRVLLTPLVAGQPVLERYLASPGASEGLTARIPPGMRALSISTDDVTGVAGFAVPGSFVDVLVTQHDSGQVDVRASLVLQNVRVLATGQRLDPEPAGKPAGNASTVTLLVSPEEAKRLSLASSLGKLQLALRSGADHRTVPGDFLSAGKAMTAPSAPSPRGQAPTTGPSQRGFTVEVIAGGKTSEESFAEKR